MDFSLLLVVAVFVTGAIWLLDIAVLRRTRKTSTGGSRPPGEVTHDTAASSTPKEPWYVDYSRAFFPVLLVVLVLRSFVIEPFQIPSRSMEPTLDVGDFIAVSKFSYGLRLPVINTKILDVGEPERGDIMVFRFPGDPSVNYIKRVIGVPGDRIRYQDKQLYINGQPVRKELLDDNSVDDTQALYREYLKGAEHHIFNNLDAPGPQMSEVTVPPGHYFMMGDNRDDSNDSRYWGFVPEENIVGRAFGVWMHWNGGLPDFTKARLLH
ncbi:signal peptidase I [Kushneria marisflavi]|uniref:Signal peptidase I n=1 Tax=Kushneria marisflavi TaxID=157779 RepID=A0A240UL30_9GAMM|nr:signal peptidase I [Kushneria marisflavi]ART61783.1 signal peptidase I [Kushneria marisflavi]RKD86813.1 signal peptidase I [Kushneria marisflavi]